MVDRESGEQQPHRDRVAWGPLIETLESGTILAAISASMGTRLKQHCSVEDIWQETLFMAWRDRETHEWTGLRGYRAWLLAIARNRVRDAIDHIDAKKRGGGHTTDAFSTLARGEDGSMGHLLPPESTTPSRVASHAERVAAMEAALEVLPSEQREVVRLSLFDELPIRAVAEQLGMSKSTVSLRLLEGAVRYRAELEVRLGRTRGRS